MNHGPGTAIRRAMLGAALLACACASQAGAFSVSPVRLELGGRVRSGAITVRNDDRVALSFQVRALRWTLDEHGNDHYDEQAELVYFPRLVTIEPGKEAVIRVGTRKPPASSEKTFRLFIEELPARAADPAPAGQQVRFLIRFGAPIFIKPAQATHRLTLLGALVQSGTVRWSLRNEGNQHERFEALALRGFDAQGEEIFVHQPGDPYLLTGQTRHYTAAVPAESCPKLARLDLEIKTSQSDLTRPVDLGASPCQ